MRNATLLAGALAAGSLAAHDLRLLGPKLALVPGETAVLRPVWSHGEGDGVPLAAAEVERLLVKDGNDTAAEPGRAPNRPPELRLAGRREGVIQALVEGQPRVVSKVREADGRHGHRDADRAAVKDAEVVSATRGRRLAKAIVVVGEPRDPPPPLGAALEIVPLDAPARWRTGAALRFRVLAAGLPLPGLKLEAGAEGASLGDDADFPQAAETDADGVAALTLPEPGLWTLRAERIAPAAAADRPRFDTERTVATLALEIRRRQGLD